MNLNEIKNVKIPFTLYDIFGYLIPGLTFLILLLLSYDIPKAIELIVLKISEETITKTYPFIFIEIVSSIQMSPIFITAFIILVSYIVGHIIAVFASLIFERFIVEKYLNYPTANLFSGKSPKWNLFFPKYRRSYGNEFIEQFNISFKKQFGIPPEDPNDIFWISFEFVANHCPNAFARSIHFLNLYGFSRNLSMSFLLSSMTLTIVWFSYDIPLSMLQISIYIFISIFLFWNYLKLLRRLNDEVYRGFYSHIQYNQSIKMDGKK